MTDQAEDVAEFARMTVSRAAQMNGYSDKDGEVLASVARTTIDWAVPIAVKCCDVLYSNPGTARIIGSYDRADREQGLALWLERLLSGAPGASFWTETVLVGYAHATVGVDNGVMIAMGNSVEEMFLARCVDALPQDQALVVYGAFRRTFEVAMATMVNAYEHAILTGVTQIGITEKLMNRMRSVAIRKMVDTGRSALPLIDWSDALSVRIAEVDSQHKVLIGLLNQLHDSSISGKHNEQLKSILADLTNYTKTHFAYEEDLFESYGYPETAAHKESHLKLTSQVSQFNDEFQEGRGRLSAELFMFLRSWLNGHIRGSDKKYARFLNAKGVH